MIKNIVFDFDGTIADSLDAMMEIINNNSENYGFKKLNQKEINHLMGKGARYFIEYLKIPKYKIPFLMKELRNKISSQVPLLRPFEKMPEVLAKLSENQIKLGILTSNSKENVEIFLKKNKMDYFSFIYHGSSLFGKDRMLKKMLREQKLNKDETAYVGDEDRDVEAAKKVGLISVSVTWGFNSKKLLKSADPDYLIDTPSELLKITKII